MRPIKCLFVGGSHEGLKEVDATKEFHHFLPKEGRLLSAPSDPNPNMLESYKVQLPLMDNETGRACMTLYYLATLSSEEGDERLSKLLEELRMS